MTNNKTRIITDRIIGMWALYLLAYRYHTNLTCVIKNTRYAGRPSEKIGEVRDMVILYGY